MPSPSEKYTFIRALRPFSFSVAVVTCLVGIVSAFEMPGFSWPVAVLILVAGVILQAGVNLINDYADLGQSLSPENETRIRRNFRIGMGCFLLAAFAGLWLVALTGPALLLLLLIGLAGALGYTLEPVNFKRRGLAVVLVFWLMGVLMVCGSYYILSGSLDWQIFLKSVPVSLISSLLLLANEIRDIDSDRQHNIHTLTVRIGRAAAIHLYRALLAMVVLIALGLWYRGLIAGWWWALSLPMVILLWRCAAEGRENLPPLSGRFFMLFGLLYCLSL